ncbi:MAG: DUF4870 domain-containing protein [Phycisphaerales bacterium]|nr:DUF4870 domain-containing protein [Phycisphaerales bacterium]
MDAQQAQETHPQPPVNDRGRAFDPDADSSERTYAVYMHLSLLAHLLMSFIAILIPLIMWHTKKEDSPFIDDHGREAINFQISIVIWTIVFALVSVPIGILTCGVGFVVALVPHILGIVGMVLAAQAANRGEFYRYPMNIRFL